MTVIVAKKTKSNNGVSGKMYCLLTPLRLPGTYLSSQCTPAPGEGVSASDCYQDRLTPM